MQADILIISVSDCSADLEVKRLKPLSLHWSLWTCGKYGQRMIKSDVGCHCFIFPKDKRDKVPPGLGKCLHSNLPIYMAQNLGN